MEPQRHVHEGSHRVTFQPRRLGDIQQDIDGELVRFFTGSTIAVDGGVCTAL
ncbi:hypothetical protein [Aquabacterium sp.]|uniref:hypothetical protein n=1 Tax=Aquabacterium sp. TaxID=1872578 RepID=UPI002B81E75B|nr:hypothetical protein [Aquabacterium sp.]HSW08929.1 hypothetical protein [Aquabacterium sp.]